MVVLSEIGTPPAMTQRVLLAGSRPPCAEAGRARFRSQRDPDVNQDLPGRGRLLRREAIALHEPCEVIGHQGRSLESICIRLCRRFDEEKRFPAARF
jgi:hypothetical protein